MSRLIDVSFEYTLNMQKYIDAIPKMSQQNEMGNIASIYLDSVNFWVPKGETENLRNGAKISAHQNYSYIDWNPPGGPAEKYVLYQYEGRVYGPNKAIFGGQGPNKNGPGAGVHTGWVSPKSPKYPTERMMGKKATIHLKDGREIKILGYTLPHTGPDWINKFFHKSSTGHDVAGTNIVAGRYAYEAYCAYVGKTPRGGFQWYRIYHGRYG